jgi:hypothetical protein
MLATDRLRLSFGAPPLLRIEGDEQLKTTSLAMLERLPATSVVTEVLILGCQAAAS